MVIISISSAHQVHRAALELGGSQGKNRGVDKTPTGQCKIDEILLAVRVDANLLENLGKEIAEKVCLIDDSRAGGKTHEVSPFPLHCVNKPKNAVTRSRLRIPGVDTKSFHVVFRVSSSSSSVLSICAYSAFTNSEVASPSA